jgi:ferredoxin
MTLVSAKMGMHEWATTTTTTRRSAPRCSTRLEARALQDLQGRGRARLRPRSRRRRGRSAASTATCRRTSPPLCIECDACVDVCPTDCLTITTNDAEARCAEKLCAPALKLAQAISTSPTPSPDQARHGQGRGRLPALRPLRRALPDRRVGHAEVRPLAMSRRLDRMSANPMSGQRFRLQDRHRQRHRLGQRQRPPHAGDLPHGDPGHARRTSSRRTSRACPPGTRSASARTATLGRPSEVDLMVALNPQTYAKDVKEVRPGGYLLYDSTWPLDPISCGTTSPSSASRSADVRRDLRGDRAAPAARTSIYAGALAALLDIDTR